MYIFEVNILLSLIIVIDYKTRTRNILLSLIIIMANKTIITIIGYKTRTGNGANALPIRRNGTVMINPAPSDWKKISQHHEGPITGPP